MTRTNNELDHARLLNAPPEDSYERLMKRRDRKQETWQRNAPRLQHPSELKSTQHAAGQERGRVSVGFHRRLDKYRHDLRRCAGAGMRGERPCEAGKGG